MRKYADIYEETIYNALLGATDLTGQNFYYTNPLVTPTRASMACVSVLRGQHPAHAAHGADVDVCRRSATACT